jgi:Predicted dioxygenase of extradiol dioxygenase family
MTNTVFHLAFKVKDIESTSRFYHDILGCEVGRQTEHWIDFNFFGHQLSAHVSTNIPALDYCGKVDSLNVPIPHFGCLLSPTDFAAVRKRLEENEIEFVVKPYTRYEGKAGEQQTMFVLDFSNNPIEFKSFTNMDEVFS